MLPPILTANGRLTLHLVSASAVLHLHCSLEMLLHDRGRGRRGCTQRRLIAALGVALMAGWRAPGPGAGGGSSGKRGMITPLAKRATRAARRAAGCVGERSAARYSMPRADAAAGYSQRWREPQRDPLRCGARGPTPDRPVAPRAAGNEQKIDLAQSMRRAGWNVLMVHYRGSWGGPGSFSFGHCLEDAAAALDWVRATAADASARPDPPRIVVIGHSIGGFLVAHPRGPATRLKVDAEMHSPLRMAPPGGPGASAPFDAKVVPGAVVPAHRIVRGNRLVFGFIGRRGGLGIACYRPSLDLQAP